MKQKQAWPGVYRSKFSGNVVLFTGRNAGYYLIADPDLIGSSHPAFEACDNDQHWESVTLRAEPAKSVAPKEKPAAPADPAPMNLFQALAWLDANRGKELNILNRGSNCGVFRVRMTISGKFECNLGEPWLEWFPDISHNADYSATIPKRKLPTPPAGYKWKESSRDLLLCRIGSECAYIAIDDDKELAAAREDVAARKCIIEEYETRSMRTLCAGE